MSPSRETKFSGAYGEIFPLFSSPRAGLANLTRLNHTATCVHTYIHAYILYISFSARLSRVKGQRSTSTLVYDCVIEVLVDSNRANSDADKFPMFSDDETRQGFFRDLDPCWFE